MPTLAEWMDGISRAKAAGDQEAVEYLTHQAQADITGPGNVAARVGAGVMDMYKGGKQLLGLDEPGEMAEHQRIAKSADPGGYGRMAGQIATAAPLMFVPGANTLAGAAATGAVTGLVAPTEDENVVRGKLMQAGLGGVAGGAVQKLAPAAARMLPRAAQKVRETAARTFPRAFPGTKQELAERAFRESIPAAERQGVVDTLTSYAPPKEVPGFQQTTAAASGNPTLLAAERQLAEAGGEMGAPIRARGEQQSRAVSEAFEREFGGGQAEAARQAATDFGGDILAGMKLSPKLLNSDQVFAGTRRLLQAQAKNSTGSIRRTLQSLNDELENAIAVARETGSYEPLHQLRIAEMGDTLSKLTREGASGTEKQLRPVIGKVKEAFDQDMSALTGGRWDKFIKGYSERATEAGQREAGAEWVDRLAARPQYASGQPQAGGLMPQLRKELTAQGGALDRFGRPKYTGSGERVLKKTLGELETAAAPYRPDVGPRGSATAQNLAPMNQVLEDARRAQAAAGRVGIADIGAGALGFAVGGPPGALVGLAKAYGLDPMRARALTDIAQRMVKMYADPQAAIDALMRAQLPAAERGFVMELLRGAAGPAGGVGAAGALAPGQQE